MDRRRDRSFIFARRLSCTLERTGIIGYALLGRGGARHSFTRADQGAHTLDIDSTEGTIRIHYTISLELDTNPGQRPARQLDTSPGKRPARQ